MESICQTCYLCISESGQLHSDLSAKLWGSRLDYYTHCQISDVAGWPWGGLSTGLGARCSCLLDLCHELSKVKNFCTLCLSFSLWKTEVMALFLSHINLYTAFGKLRVPRAQHYCLILQQAKGTQLAFHIPGTCWQLEKSSLGL